MDVHSRETRSYNMSQIRTKIQNLKKLSESECELKRDKQTTRLNKLYLEITQKET